MLDTGRLDQQVSVFVDALGKKAQSVESKLDHFFQQQSQHDNSSRSQCQQKRDLIQKLRQQAEETAHKKQELEAERMAVEEQEQELLTKLPHLQQSLKETQEEVLKLRQALQAAETDLTHRETKMQTSRHEMQTRLEKYSSALGLTFERQGDSIAFTFRHILQDDPERPFSIGLTLMNERTYKIVSCEPPLDCLRVLESSLVQTNDMKHFMTSVRKAFQLSAQKKP